MPVEKINGAIFTGGIGEPAEEIERNGVKCVINLCGIPTAYRSEMLPINNGGKNDPGRFAEIMKSIEANEKMKRIPILIQCQRGQSRSIVIAALYLYYSRRYPTFDDALFYVINKSRFAAPNPDLVDFVRKRVLPLLRRPL